MVEIWGGMRDGVNLVWLVKVLEVLRLRILLILSGALEIVVLVASRVNALPFLI